MEFSVHPVPVSGRSVRTFTLVKVEAGMASGATSSPMVLLTVLPMSSFTCVTVVEVVRPVYLPSTMTAVTVTATWYSALE